MWICSFLYVEGNYAAQRFLDDEFLNQEYQSQILKESS